MKHGNKFWKEKLSDATYKSTSKQNRAEAVEGMGVARPNDNLWLGAYNGPGLMGGGGRCNTKGRVSYHA